MNAEGPPKRTSTLIVSLLLIECTSVLIALALTFAPTHSDSRNTLAHLFFDDPDWIFIALTYYVVTNVLMGILAIIFIVWLKANK